MPQGKYFKLYKKDIKEIGGLIEPDEEFRKAKGVRSVYVSNYGRVISKRTGKPRLLKSYFLNGYHSIVVENENKKRKNYFVHILVAKAFVEVPDWINKDDRKEVHHIQKVDRKCEIEYSDRASNLCWLPPKIHKIVDSEEVAVKINGQYVSMDFVKIAEFYGVSPYALAKTVGNVWKKPPTKQEDNIYYYQMPLEDGDKKVNIDIRIVRPQDEHVSRKT